MLLAIETLKSELANAHAGEIAAHDELKKRIIKEQQERQDKIMHERIHLEKKRIEEIDVLWQHI